jgi:CheY-like chemotaxis protein
MPTLFRVLVAADYMMRSMLQRIIEADYAAANVSMAENGLQALQSCGEETIDLLITDNYMPSLSGLSLIRGVREFDALLPIIFLSNDLLASRLAYAAGANYSIEKPFRVDDLRVALRSLLP